MGKNTTFFKELLIRKAMGLPATTSNKNPKARSEATGAGWYKQSLPPPPKTDVPTWMIQCDGFY